MAYTSYSYLPDGTIPQFELDPEVDRVPAYDLGLDAEQTARAEALLRESMVISLHDHPTVFPKDVTEIPAYNRTGRQHTAFEGLRRSGVTAVFDNMADGTACITGQAPWRWGDVITDLGMRQADIAHQSDVVVARSVADIEQAKRDGRVAVVFGLEAATPIENELDRLDVLFGLGLRQIGIAYSESNMLGGGLVDGDDGGLTRFGVKAVARMNQVGLAIDVSHSNDRTGIETCEASSKPVFMTHAGARALWDIPRLKRDPALKAIADTGGVVGMSAAPHTTISYDHRSHSLDSVMDHFEYTANLIGIEHVAFGPDTLFVDHVGLHTQFAGLLSGAMAAAPEHPRVKYVEGLESMEESFHNITGWLVKHGYSDDDIRAVLGGNIMRALREIWPQ
ncbi:dipeptidase [Microbacterium profundi]|uniref:dipeptidase n=1 Tax=Microbacterium profundi TaxID=450380 RepID=UPI001F392485|nr:membrane dipeptidase [Microbacterium profundi]MCE7482010.1 dipeptidase [Microbacterium profundi]